MDAAALMAFAAAGVVAGVVASAVPGLHVNALAVAVLALAPDAGPQGVVFLVAAFAASPFGLALGATFLGASGDDENVSASPARELAMEGRAAEAVALQAWGAWTGILVALPLAFLLRGLLQPAEPWLGRAMPWLLLAVILILALTETRRLPVRRRWVVVAWKARRVEGTLTREPDLRVGRVPVADPHGLVDDVEEGARICVEVEPTWCAPSRWAGRAAALGVLLLSGALGLAAFRLGAASPFGVPASPLLPLLAGLFALPELARGLRPGRGAPRVRLPAPRTGLAEVARDAAPGSAVSCGLGLVPGVSASHVALALPEARTPERRLVRAAAVNGGAVVFTLLAWHVLGKARSGVLVAAEALAPPFSWASWTPAPEVAREAALVLAAATAACLLARLASWPLARLRHASRLSLAGLVLMLGCVAAFNGALGLAVLAAAGLVGETTRRLGVRRGHAMGVILVPALLRAWALA